MDYCCVLVLSNVIFEFHILSGLTDDTKKYIKIYNFAGYKSTSVSLKIHGILHINILCILINYSVYFTVYLHMCF